MKTYEKHELTPQQLKPAPQGLPRSYVDEIAETPPPDVPDEWTKLQIEETVRTERMREREAARPVDTTPALEHIATAVEALDNDLQERLDRIVQWADAYPLDIFPKPDLVAARALLGAGGQTLDAISADAMRHALTGVKRIALGEDRNLKNEKI